MSAWLPLLLTLLTCAPGAPGAPDAAAPAPPEPTPLAAVPIDPAALARIGSAEYVFQRRDANGELTRIGSFTMQTRTTPAEPATVRFSDRFDGAVRRGKVVAEWSVECRVAPGLPMSAAESVESYDPTDPDDDAKRVERRLTLDGGTGTVVARGPDGERVETFELRDGAVVDFALMRLVPLLERTPGARWSAPAFFETEDMAVRDEAVIVECVGPATIMVIQRQVECTRYRLLRDGKPRAEYFVGPDGSLERIEFDDVKVLDRRLPKVG